MNSPAISVIIPTKNRIELLQKALNSVRNQTFKDWEALIIDDGSNSETIEQLLIITQSEPQIRYIKRQREQSGASACRNQGSEVAQAKYIIYLDSDDCLASTALENRFQEMEQHPELDFGIFGCILFNREPGDMNLLWNADTGIDDIDRFLAIDPPWQTTSPIWRRESLAKIGLWDEAVPSWQDWEFHIRALIANLKYQRFPQADCFWRVPQVESIGLKSVSPEHLNSHEKLFGRMLQRFLEAELLTKQRQVLFAGLYMWLAEAWITRVTPARKLEALKVWQVCYEQNLLEQKVYLQGLQYLEILGYLYLKLSDSSSIEKAIRKAMRRLNRIYFDALLPNGVIQKWSKTLHKAPMSNLPEIRQVNYKI
jgi:glycosyltransferase involved in cell wall biosynthesis